MIGGATHDATLRCASRSRASWGSIVVLLIAAAPRVWAAFEDQSVFSPEEIYEGMEPAHRFAFGWGLLAKAYRDNSHSWLFPGALGLAWKAASAVGVHTPAGFVSVAKGGMAALSIAGVWLAMSLARRIGGERAAILTGLLASMCAPLVAFGSRTFPETMSVPLVVGAALLLEGKSERRALAAGTLALVATLLRYEEGVIAAGLLVFVLGRRRASEQKAFVIGGAVVFALGQILDWATIGAPFRALLADLRVNFLSAEPWTYGKAVLFYYPDHLTSSMGVSFAIVLLGLVVAAQSRADRPARGLIATVVAYLLLITLHAHKDLRLVLPVLPIMLAVGAVGLTRMFDGLRAGAWVTYAGGVVMAAQMAWTTHAPTRADLGYGAADVVTWHSGEDYMLVTEEAAKTPDLCGIIYTGNDPGWTGGYSFLHRKIPIFFDLHADHLAAANAVVAGVGDKVPSGWRRVSTNGKYALWERQGACAAAPKDWSMVLP